MCAIFSEVDKKRAEGHRWEDDRPYIKPVPLLFSHSLPDNERTSLLSLNILYATSHLAPNYGWP